MIVTVPGLGTLIEEEFDWLASEPLDVQALGSRCRFIVDGFEPSEAASLTASVQSFCALTAAGLKREAGDHVWAYYRDFAARYVDEPGFPSISGADQIWDFVTFGDEVWVKRDGSHWYVSVENECAWEPEHGLELVFKDGRQLVKVGQVDGHLTNRGAFGDGSIPEDAVYWSPF